MTVGTSTLEQRIKAQIRIDGPISISQYMALCLLDADQGYYTTAKPFGVEGDFITAPEISQMFGELIGVFARLAWRTLGCPSRFCLAEIGPGRGTLMDDLLRACKTDQQFMQAADIVLIEASPQLRQLQKQKLKHHQLAISWLNSIDGLPALPLILIGNELLDALPLRQFIFTNGSWHERMITLDENDALSFGIGTAQPPADLIAKAKAPATEGTVLEYSPAREAITAQLAHHIHANQGTVLWIDYGHLQTGFGDTFQAVKDHQFVNPLADCGMADLTSHVDFDCINDAAKSAGALATASLTQADFLLKLGLLERAGQLGHGKNQTEQQAIQAAVQRLAGNGPNDMGDLFKTFVMTSTKQLPPPFASD